MKRTLLALSLISIAGFTTKAQITITTADVATAGKVIYQANDTIPTVSIGSAGASQTWNMTALASDRVDTLYFMNHNWTSDTNYPTSNLVVKQGWQNAYSFLINSPSGLSALGNGGMVNIGGTMTYVNQANSPAEVLAPFPYTYNSTNNGSFATHAKFYYGQMVTIGGFPVMIDSIRDNKMTNKTSLVDAWGNITTPMSATAFAAIRSKETNIVHDTIDAYITAFGGWTNASTSADSTTKYTWWANGVGFPLVTATMDSTSNVKSVQWLKVMPVTGVNEYTAAAQVNVFPVPAQNEVNLALNSSNVSSVQIYDITGRLSATVAVTSDITTINTSAYANGMYSYSIIAKNGQLLSRGKFAVVK